MDAEIVDEEGDGVNHDKPEYQFGVFVPEHQMSVGLEVEQHTDDGAEQVGPKQRVDMGNQTEKETQQGEDAPAKRGV